MFTHFCTNDVLIYLRNYDKFSLMIKVHVNVFCRHEWLCMMNFFVDKYYNLI